MLGHKQPKNFSRSELFLLQLLAGDLGWAIRELRCRQNYQRLQANLSHELKNSLNVIMGDCALLREDLEPSLKPDERTELANIEATSQEILSLISTFLDGAPSGASSEAVAEEDIELSSFLDDVLMSFRTKAKSAGFDLQIHYADDLPRAICTDPVRFRHVVRNLASCALESAGQHPRRIDVKRNGSMLELTVNGIDTNGSTNGQLTFLDDATCDPKMAGFPISLELIKEHVEFLKGHVHIVSGAEKKSDITVCLPCE